MPVARHAFALALLLSGAPAKAQPVPEGIHSLGEGPPDLCSTTAPDIPALEAALAARLPPLPGNERYVAYEDAPNMRIWTFTTAAHPAHPAVACRSVVEENGNVGTRTEIACHSTRANCDALYREFEELNARTMREMGQTPSQ